MGSHISFNHPSVIGSMHMLASVQLPNESDFVFSFQVSSPLTGEADAISQIAPYSGISISLPVKHTLSHLSIKKTVHN
jgi:hypothetical protein